MINKRINNITGQRFGKLVALYPTDKRVGRNVVWHCRCDCGNEVETVITNLKGGRTKSCHKCFSGLNLAGQRFGKVVAIACSNERYPSNGSIIWRCKCDCGNEFFAPAHRLRDGNITSCGCDKTKSRKSCRDVSDDWEGTFSGGRFVSEDKMSF